MDYLLDIHPKSTVLNVDNMDVSRQLHGAYRGSELDAKYLRRQRSSSQTGSRR